MALIFEDVAKNILKETISNALFVDDKALEPFRSRTKIHALKADHDRSRALFKDFKSNECSLHVAKFSKSSWKRDKKFNLSNKDLLILDWQLVRDEHEESLKILDESVLNKGLHFCCIYTQASLEEVKNELNRFYLGKVTSEKISEIRELLNETDLNNYWIIDNQDTDWINFDAMINNIVNSRNIDIELQITAFKDKYKLTDEIIQSIRTIDPSFGIRSSFVKLKSILSLNPGRYSNISSQELIYRLSEVDDKTIYINHTIIKLFEKGMVSGSDLYNSFFESIMQEKNIFLTLMGLEMRNRFRENSAFIGKDLDNVSEEAFFYHKFKNRETPHVFIDFLREILKDQVAAFLYEKDLMIFKVLDDYSEKKEMPKKIADFESDANSLMLHSFKLNKFYNLINLSARKSNDFLRLGDVFKATVNKKNKKDELEAVTRYFVCITALCDCLRPEKINKQFWFVEGQEIESQVSALKGSDGKFISFLPKDDLIVAVDWSNSKSVMPFAMNVHDGLINHKLKADYYQQGGIIFELIASLKENYAQRIANEAFGYPIRVGIDFVKKS